MSWVCSNCSNNNSDSLSTCDVCGSERPVHVVYPESTESKVVFSTFGVIAETTKNTCKSIAKAVKGIGKLLKKAGSAIVTLGGKAADGIKGTKEKLSAPKAKKSGSEKPKREKKIKAPKLLSPFEEPWPEHKIEFDIPAIKAKGYVKAERAVMNTVKGYYFYRADGTYKFLRPEMLVVLKFAKNK